jgi:hypothetical protein
LTLFLALWNTFGSEVVWVTSRTLSVKRDLFGFGRTTAFSAESICNMRAVGVFGRPPVWSYNFALYGFGPGVVAFEQDRRTRRFGMQLEEGEARQLVERLRQHLPLKAFLDDRHEA